MNPLSCSTSPELLALLEKAAKYQMTAAERRQQRISMAAAEAEFGDDEDEAEYRKALFSGDEVTLERLKAEGKARREHVLKMFGDGVI